MGTELLNTEEVRKEVSELEHKIIRQIEYYFGNFNLQKDKFLRELIKEDDGWITLETMLKFNRLKSLSEDSAIICEALKKNPDGLIEVNDDCTKIRRKVDKPIPDEFKSSETLDDRTLYVKGFKKTTTLDELLEYFKDHKAENILMRRFWKRENKPFKGSCFVLFETKDAAEKFLNLKVIKFENTELLRETKKGYIKRKDEFYNSYREEKAKKLQQKSSNAETEVKDKPDAKKIIKHIGDMVPGCLLKLVGLGTETLREDIKGALEEFGEIAFVDYSKGKPEAVVRFTTAVAAKAFEAMEVENDERKCTIGSFKATMSLIEGEDEQAYWKNIGKGRADHKEIYKAYKKAHRGRFNRSWNKRSKDENKEDEDGDQPPSKKQKTEVKEEKNGSEEKMKESES